MNNCLSTDISPDFRPNRKDAKVIRRIIKHDASPRAIEAFAAECHKLSDYGYWFTLGTLWVNYTGYSDIQRWKWLFFSHRKGRFSGLMKPSEHVAWRTLPVTFVAYRVHRPNERDWISYTVSLDVARRRAANRPSPASRRDRRVPHRMGSNALPFHSPGRSGSLDARPNAGDPNRDNFGIRR